MAQTSGGPDSYGYEWRDSNDPNGPSYNWIDITAVGTPVAGLADDNSVGPFPMGMDFHYYWSDYNQIKIGSNGWVSFNNVANISSCFPTIPSTSPGHNLIAPYMTDVNFAGAGNNGEIYTFNTGGGQFIISYVDVPYWTNNAAGYIGSSTFQIIFDNADSSITFQYQTTDAANAPIGNCGAPNADFSVGIENLTGNIGLGVYNNAVPPSNYAIKFYYPDVVTLAVPDVAPLTNMNPDNAADFYLPSDAIAFSCDVQNTGNVDVNSATTVSANVTNAAGGSVFSDNQTVASLMQGMGTMVNFAGTATLAPGYYTFSSSTSNTDDINPSNNTNTSELRVVDLSGPTVEMTYASGDTPNGGLSWNGGGGMDDGAAQYMVPPAYPATVTAIEVFAISADAADDAFTVQLIADDGPGGTPGTVLASESVANGTFTSNSWVNVELTSPVNVASGGFYVVWLMDGNSTQIGQEDATLGPISRRSFEILGGAISPYRNNGSEDFMMKAILDNTFVAVEEQALSQDVRVYPSLTDGLVTVEFDLNTNISGSMLIVDALGQVIKDEIIDEDGNYTQTYDLSAHAAGLYTIVININGSLVTKQVLLAR